MLITDPEQGVTYECGAAFAAEAGSIRVIALCPTPSTVQANLIAAYSRRGAIGGAPRRLSSTHAEILAVLVDEYQRDGHEIIHHDGEAYARLVEKTSKGAIVLAEINLHTLASQIDRRLT
ncbi:hypothetical protein [Gellertiella hungarica]|uniref:Uncharacterized protein n=1 Tax=Gellertiella hungarica TaxID=1572859 RepID=A0A7W6J7I7_9HYPH|nr:hypothetical protein [Gellertiella hungarica]MBB4066253.1 hypothetical protein [Gellertiella hungarica]